MVHPLKPASVIPVKPAVCSNPQNTILCLGNIICLATRKSVIVIVNRLHIHIIRMILCLLCRHSHRIPQHRSQQQKNDHNAGFHMIRTDPRYLFLILACFISVPETKSHKKRHQRNYLIQKIYIKLTDHATHP